MPFRETVSVYCEKHTRELCEQNSDFWYVEEGGTYIVTTVFKGLVSKS
jgi:hypothetical protein